MNNLAIYITKAFHSGAWIAATLILACPAATQWSTDPVVNNAICTTTGDQDIPVIASDGAGGAIIAWEDYRNGSWDVYAQRISALGALQWITNGVSIFTAGSDQFHHECIETGRPGIGKGSVEVAAILEFDRLQGVLDSRR